MKQLTVATLGASWLAVILASIGWFVVINLDYALARYPASMRVGTAHLHLLSAPRGYISQRGGYQTGDDVMSVWYWYGKHFGLEPADGMNAEGQCVRLTNTNQHVFIRRTIRVLLCSARHRTLVYVSQAMDLQH